jgi:hypothetical protein
VDRAINYVLKNAKPGSERLAGLLNIADGQRDMYNHGLATFVLGQAHGMTSDPRISTSLDRALKLIANTQCEDGGWDYRAQRQANGHDLSLAVMQAKALRSAVDSGLEVPPEVVELAIKSVREHYGAANGRPINDPEQTTGPGQFGYSKGGGGATIAMAAAGVVCLQEFGQYDDWRIPKNMEVISKDIKDKIKAEMSKNGNMSYDAYTLYYVGQALYQVGDPYWRECYPLLRDHLVGAQLAAAGERDKDGLWHASGRVDGKPGDLYGTSVACFVLAMPNRYLPILQEGKISQFQKN